MIEFTESQKKSIASGLTVLSVAVVVAFVALVAWGILRLIAFASPALVPVISGFFLALFFKPYYRLWQRTVHNPTFALILMLATIFVPVGLLLWYAGSIVVVQLHHLIQQGPEMIHRVVVWFQSTCPGLDSLLKQIGFSFDDVGMLYTKYGDTAYKAGAQVLNCMSGVVSFVVTLIFFVFFLTTKDRRGGEIVAHLPFLKERTKEFLAEQIDAFVDILVSFFQRQTVICLIEGMMYGTGFWLVGLPYGFIIGLLLGVMNLIPLFGSVLCLPLALPLAYFGPEGSGTRMIMVLVVWLCGQILDGYLITPRIQGDKTGLGYAGVIFSFFFWSVLLGPMLGMLLAIPLSAFCVVLWRALKSNYIKPIV